MPISFHTFFAHATGGREPYPYQQRFADADTLPHLLRAPTGAGKTATAVLGWLWRLLSKKPDTPRRLVYCLPMRVLVEQSTREARNWIDELVKHGDLEKHVPVHVLMGGTDTEEWYLEPEKPAVLIGTQDMLLSRALNRGYAASRFHWPIDFGLLNNDSLWVFDEPQLMGNGVSTSAQLAGLRKALSTFGSCPSVWMSATLEPCWLDTVDFRGKFPEKAVELGKDQYGDDYDPERMLYTRMTAVKTLASLGVMATKDGKEAASAVVKAHVKGTQTLVVLNTVDRAKAVYAAIKKDKTAPKDVLLVHSRFRPEERERLNTQFQAAATDRIIVATQVVEAGVDISARTLVTELAPWASIVQRIGRCNRTGDDGPGQVFWMDIPATDPNKKEDKTAALPYLVPDLIDTRRYLGLLEGKSVSPKSLDDFKTNQEITLPFEHKHVLRRRDLLDLFDTAPDLSGNDIDIQRFVRSDDPDTDVQVFWRAFPNDGPTADEPSPHRRELCSVPVGQARGFLEMLAEKKRGAGYIWDHLDEQWVKLDPKRVRPGLAILLPVSAGGYALDLGWNAEATDAVTPLPPPDSKPEGASDDPLSAGPPLTIEKHTSNVCAELEMLLGSLSDLGCEWSSLLRRAARWHDAGKAHAAFQHGMRTANPALPVGELWAKSGVKSRLRHGRKFFRHELASALASLQNAMPFEAAYLIAAHHGKVRLVIRALPGEEPPPGEDVPFALGVHHGDKLPTVKLGDGQTWSENLLDLSPMRLGREQSWTANALKLLASLGPFKLAYLEALLRAADVRASQKEANNV
jgi:CRISPR-associated endonuclease/helicase Cas3